jgi:pimeloyl-ACP methyl ester carboxylesterase
MANDTIRFLERVVGSPVRLLGYSDGACVALTVALRRPDLVSRLVFVGGVFHYEGWMPGVIDSTERPPDFMAASYGEVSPDGQGHFPIVVEKLAQMHLNEPALTGADLSRITSRTLVMVGDDDEVRLEHGGALPWAPQLRTGGCSRYVARPHGREDGPLPCHHCRLLVP